jgi:tetratricopeptide (TPR) repeat protein
MYVEQGNEAIALALTPNLPSADKDYQFEFAKAMYSTALECRPSSGQALAGIAIASLYQKKFDDAVKFADAATKASPNYAAAFYTNAAALAAKDAELAKSYTAVVNAQTKDPGNDIYRKQRAAIEALRPALLKNRTDSMIRAEALDARNLRGRSTPTVDNVYKYFNTTGRTPVISVPARG